MQTHMFSLCTLINSLEFHSAFVQRGRKMHEARKRWAETPLMGEGLAQACTPSLDVPSTG